MGRLFAVVSIVLLSALSRVSFADGVPVQPEGPSGMMQLIFFGGFILIFYFLMWRPQSKRAKEHKDLIGGLSKGDEVVTTGGVLGKVSKVNDDYVAIEVSNGVELKVQKIAVAQTLPKGTLKQI